MVQHGTVVNGVIVPDGPPPPEGTRVQFRAETEADEDEWPDLPHPQSHETYEEHLAMLWESIAEMRAGIPGMTLAEFAAELERDYGPAPKPER